MKVGEKVSPNGGCYLTFKINGRVWSSYWSTPPTKADIRAIEVVEASIKRKGDFNEKLTMFIDNKVFYSQNGNPILPVEMLDTPLVREVLKKAFRV